MRETAAEKALDEYLAPRLRAEGIKLRFEPLGPLIQDRCVYAFEVDDRAISVFVNEWSPEGVRTASEFARAGFLKRKGEVCVLTFVNRGEPHSQGEVEAEMRSAGGPEWSNSLTIAACAILDLYENSPGRLTAYMQPWRDLPNGFPCDERRILGTIM